MIAARCDLGQLSGRLIGAGAAAHFRTSAAEHGADAVFRHADDVANFLVGLAFKMIHADDRGFGTAELAQQSVEYFVVADPLFEIVILGSGLMDHVAQRRGRPTVDELADDDSTGDDGKVSGQGALAAEMTEHGQVIVDDGEEYFCCQVFAIRGGEAQRPALGGVVDDMDDEPHVAVDKIFPGPRLVVQAAVEEIAVNIR